MKSGNESMTTETMTASWSDRKRYIWLLSPALPLLVLNGLYLFHRTHLTIFTWGAPVIIYLVIPFLDFAIGQDRSNAPDWAITGLEADRYYRIIVAAFIPTQFVLTFWGAWIATHEAATWLQYAGLVFSVGAVNGIAINTAHELGHKKDSWERWLSKITLAPVAYGHFYVEHNRGHHRNVATPEDPASARLGESFWEFLPRTAIGSLRSAWRIEKERLARQGRTVWHWDNDNLQAWGMTVVLFAAITAWAGWWALPFLLVQAVYGASLLEAVNYLEHYGLLRQKTEDGRYERCLPEHSWNSNYIMGNVFLYQLQRHSDHHANPTRRYQALRHYKNSPQLPSGYAGLLLAAYIPPVWFRWMNRRVVAQYGGDVTKANIHPRVREKILARYAGA
jgi:alkane 1-monooxygenase